MSVVVFEDEASLSNKWSKKGNEPKIEQQQNRKERCTLSSFAEPNTVKLKKNKTAKSNTLSFFQFLMLVCMQYQE